MISLHGKRRSSSTSSRSRRSEPSKPRSSTSSRKSVGKEDARPVVLASRASPPPKDDFDEDVVEEANDYATERKLEQERKAIKEQNIQRKKEGLTALKVPPKYKKEETRPSSRASSKRARHDNDAESESEDNIDDEWRRLAYEGQKILRFDPLPILVEIEEGHFRPDEIIREMDPHADHVASPPREEPDVPASAIPIELMGTVGVVNNVLAQPDTPAEINNDAAKPVASPPETVPDMKPDISLDSKPDIKPDIKPDVQAFVAPVVPAAPVVPTTEDDDAEEIEEEEDYGDDDVVVVPWLNTSLQSELKPPVTTAPVIKPEPMDWKPDVKPDTKPDIKPDMMGLYDSSDIEEQEEYSEDELFESFDMETQQNSLSMQMDSINSKLLEAMTERPAFPCADEQRRIEAYPLDPDDPSMVIPASINRFLRGYQREGVWFLYSKYRHGMGGILGDDMGLGKTVQVIAFLSAIMRKTGTAIDGGRRKNLIRRTGDKIPPQQWATALLVCPTSLISNWSRELDTWGYFEYAIWTTGNAESTLKSMQGGYLDIVLISTDLVHKAADDLKKLPFSVVIVDEAHRMKNHHGRLGFAVKKIPCKSCFALTGTLIQNRLDEMWSVLDFAQRGWAGTLKQWRDFAVNPINRGHRHDGTIQQVTNAILRIGQVYQRILPHFYLRRDKSLIAGELPKKRDLLVLCPLGARQEAVYKRIIESDDVKFILLAKEECDCGSGMQRSKCCYKYNSQGHKVNEAILRMFDALGRVANHMALLYHSENDPERVRETNRRVFEFCVGEPYDPARHNVIEAAYDPDNCGKWTLLKAMLEEWRSKPEENNKVLLFSNSVRLLKYIKDFIDAQLAGFDADIFSGEVDKEERMNIVDRFQDPNSNTFIMLVSTMAGGVGLNLTAANKVIIFDPNWNPANDLQAMDRAFRFGQKRDVDIYRFVSKGTIEELMYERQIYKQQRARQLNNGTFERRTHKGFEGAVSKEDKGDLFGVHNIFRYDPEGYVKGNLDRVRLAEENLRQDFMAEQYESDSDGDDDEAAKQMRQYRREKAIRKVAQQSDAQEDRLMNEILSDGGGVGASKPKATQTADQLLAKLKITTLAHNEAFRDSPEERAIYEKGIQVLLERPDLADLPANEIGKVRLESERKAKKAKRAEPEVVEEPWQERFVYRKNKNKAAKNLVSLDDD